MKNAKLTQRGTIMNNGVSKSEGQALISERKSQPGETENNQVKTIFEKNDFGLSENGFSYYELSQKLESIIEAKTQELEKALQEAQDTNAKYEYSALHDALTDLPNRRYFRKKLDEFVEKSREENISLAMIHIDLDRFKQINDSLGHAAGDHVLQYVAQVLKRVQNNTTFPARLGGDEFVIITTFDGSTDTLDELGDNLLESLSKDISYQGTLLRFGASIGIAHQRGRAIDPRKLMTQSDLALYEVKKLGRGDISYFTSDLAIRAQYKNQLLEELYTAVDQEQFVPYYHPRVNAETKSIEGFEVLARWQHPKRGILVPEFFLSACDELGITDKIDHIILKRALADFRRWNQENICVPNLSLNMSHARLTDPLLLEQLEILNIPSGKLHFELTESSLLDHAESEIIVKINEIKNLGIGIEIDDFGSGQASVISAMNVKPNAIKIDSRLISNILTDQKQVCLLKAFLQIGRALNVEVVVEGTETYDHVARCVELGCTILQGHAFSKPMPSSDVGSFIKDFSFPEEV